LISALWIFLAPRQSQTELDALLKDISDPTESFLQTLHVRIRTSFNEVEGDAENNYELDREELPMLPQFTNNFPAQSYFDEERNWICHRVDLAKQACYIGLHRLPCDLGAFSCPIFSSAGMP
jgi:hypothetical protein